MSIVWGAVDGTITGRGNEEFGESLPDFQFVHHKSHIT
jgi:hypothetical protein